MSRARRSGKAHRIGQKEGTLLLNSQVILDYPWLLELLRRDPVLSESQIGAMSIEHQNIISGTLPRLVQQAADEFKSQHSSQTQTRARGFRVLSAMSPISMSSTSLTDSTGGLLTLGETVSRSSG